MISMSDTSLDMAAREVADRLPLLRGHGRIVPLGNHGGFSGARLWRWEGDEGRYCIKAWPAGEHDYQGTVAFAHRAMNRARRQGLLFVPTLRAAEVRADRMWEVTDWMPGKADFHQFPTKARLEAALIALARLHVAWHVNDPSRRAQPSVGLWRRFDRATQWTERIESSWQPVVACDPSGLLTPLVHRAWPLLRHWLPCIAAQLAPWRQRVSLLQPCLCDIWHDHVLFQSDQVSGIVDFGSLRDDDVTVDVARLLGSLVGDNGEQWTIGLEAYRRVRPLSVEEEALARALDRTGTIIGLANWLNWLCTEPPRDIDNPQRAAERIQSLLGRLESWV
jgi:Ser/Thr protein kinase RdoA (MazF antagonist)